MAEDKMVEKAIFNVARQIKSPDARREYLRNVCGADTALLARLETLLQAYAEQSSFLETPPAQSISPTSDVSPTIGLPLIERAGTVIGPYKLLQQIGEGGMGLVYMAEQSKPIARMVALKIIKPGMDTQQVVARFEAERQDTPLFLLSHTKTGDLEYQVRIGNDDVYAKWSVPIGTEWMVEIFGRAVLIRVIRVIGVIGGQHLIQGRKSNRIWMPANRTN